MILKFRKDKAHNKTIELGDGLFLEMKYPSLDEFIKTNFDPNEVLLIWISRLNLSLNA